MTKRKKSDINKPLSGDNHATQKDQRQKWPFWIGTGGRFQSESLAVFVGMRSAGADVVEIVTVLALSELALNGDALAVVLLLLAAARRVRS